MIFIVVLVRESNMLGESVCFVWLEFMAFFFQSLSLKTYFTNCIFVFHRFFSCFYISLFYYTNFLLLCTLWLLFDGLHFIGIYVAQVRGESLLFFIACAVLRHGFLYDQ